jgi:hypothetical protein
MQGNPGGRSFVEAGGTVALMRYDVRIEDGWKRLRMVINGWIRY